MNAIKISQNFTENLILRSLSFNLQIRIHYHKNGSFHLCTNGHKNKDISGAGMKDKIPSPNSSSNDTRRCPESKSFFHI